MLRELEIVELNVDVMCEKMNAMVAMIEVIVGFLLLDLMDRISGVPRSLVLNH